MPDVVLTQIANVAARECEKQQVGLDRLVMLLRAYRTVMESWPDPAEGTTDYLIGLLAATIEPKTRGIYGRFPNYRMTPVTFRDGGSSCPPAMINEKMEDLIYHLPRDVAEFRKDENEWWIQNWIMEFLWVHPFRDGNGRTAWVLYNWMSGTMHSPYPLPSWEWLNSGTFKRSAPLGPISRKDS